MSNTLYTGLSLDVRHLPETDKQGKPVGPFETQDEATQAGYDTLTPVTGFVQVGVNLDGHFFPLATVKAPGVLADIQRAKANAPVPPASDTQTPPPAQG